MARPGQVVEVVARMLGISEATVMLHNRNLREAGSREKQNRGRGKGSVSSQDVARLLVSVLDTTSPKESDDAARRCGGLLLKADDRSKLEDAPQRLRALPSDHTFADGLTALIEDATSGATTAWAAEKLGCAAGEAAEEDLHMRVGISSPSAQATIGIWPVRDGEELPGCELGYGRAIYNDPETGKNRFDPPFTPLRDDLGWERHCSGATTFAIAKVMSE